MIAIVSCKIVSGNLEEGVVEDKKLSLIVPNDGNDGVHYLWEAWYQLPHQCIEKKPAPSELSDIVFRCARQARNDEMPLTAELLDKLQAFIDENYSEKAMNMSLNFNIYETDEEVFQALEII